jgi:hypothetical protein
MHTSYRLRFHSGTVRKYPFTKCVDFYLSSVRAWRGLRYNEAYGVKLKQKQKHRLELQRQQAEKDARTLVSQPQKPSSSSKSNPFTVRLSLLLFS